MGQMRRPPSRHCPWHQTCLYCCSPAHGCPHGHQGSALLAPGCVLAWGEEPGCGATSMVGVWSAPLAAHRCTGSAVDEQEAKPEVALLCVLSFACCFLQQHTHMKLCQSECTVNFAAQGPPHGSQLSHHTHPNRSVSANPSCL